MSWKEITALTTSLVVLAACSPSPVHPVELPTLLPSATPNTELFTAPTIKPESAATIPIPIPIPIPTPINTPTRFPSPSPVREHPTVVVLPTPEVIRIPSVSPGDIIASNGNYRKIIITDADGSQHEEWTGGWNILRPDGSKTEISLPVAEYFGNNGYAISHNQWAPDGKRTFVNNQGKEIVSIETSANIRGVPAAKIDVIGAQFVYVPAVNSGGQYGVVFKEIALETYVLQAFEATRSPHHNGPMVIPGLEYYRISSPQFDVATERRGDLILNAIYKPTGTMGIIRITNVIVPFPKYILDADGSAKWEESDLKMKYIRNTPQTPRIPDHTIRIIPVPGGEGLNFNSIIFKPYP